MNNKGNLSMLGILLILLVFSATLSSLLQTLKTHNEIKERTQSYLCFRYLTTESDKYIKKMGSLNKLISLAYKAKFIPPITAKAQAAHQTLILSQQGVHFSFMKKISSTKFCSFEQKAGLVITPPYKSQLFLLSRKIDGTVPLRSREWEVNVTGKNFVLRGKYKVTDHFSTGAKLETNEEALSLRPLFGYRYL